MSAGKSTEWTQAEEMRAIELLAQGVSYRKLATLTGRTEGALRSRLHGVTTCGREQSTLAIRRASDRFGRSSVRP